MKKSQIFWLVLFAVAITIAAALALIARNPEATEPPIVKTYYWTCPGLGDEFTVELNFDEPTTKTFQNKKRPIKMKGAPNDYYENFIKDDPAVKQLAKKLQSKAIDLCQDDSNMTDKVFAQLAINFVQSLPYNYDEVGPDKIAVCDYAYITLHRQSGTCFDKTLLAIGLLKEYGFGVAMLYFDSIPLPDGGYDQHVTLGLAADRKQYIDDLTYVELSRDPREVGFVPESVCRGQLGSYTNNTDQQNKSNFTKLGPVEIYLASKGKKYKF